MADFFSNGYGSGLIGGALGMVGGAIQYNRQKKLMAQQYQYALGMAQQNQQYAKEMAGINQGYAKEMAGINQQHNKDMFDHTNNLPSTLAKTHKETSKRLKSKILASEKISKFRIL